MKDSSGAVIHLVKLINTADAIVTQHKSTPIDRGKVYTQQQFQKSQDSFNATRIILQMYFT